MLKFNYRYFVLTVVLFLIELLIALFVHDEIIRPHIGDLLVVILIYCFLKSFLDITVLFTAIATLLFSYTIEILQYFNIVEKLGLQNSKPARIFAVAGVPLSNPKPTARRCLVFVQLA